MERIDRKALTMRALKKYGIGFAIIGVCLFLCAGSINYINGWLFLASLILPMTAFFLHLLVKDPAALERRLLSTAPEKARGENSALGGVLFLSMFILSGLDFRLGWSRMPLELSLAATVIMLAGFLMFVVVINQNRYAARVIDVFDNQKLISDGLYSIIRHPMYLASLLVFIPMPFVLGSYYSLAAIMLYPLILIKRIKTEEAFLAKELKGYAEYMNKVKYRLLPYIW